MDHPDMQAVERYNDAIIRKAKEGQRPHRGERSTSLVLDGSTVLVEYSVCFRRKAFAGQLGPFSMTTTLNIEACFSQ